MNNPLIIAADAMAGDDSPNKVIDGIKGKRKLKGIFGNAFKGEKERTNDSEKGIPKPN